MQLFLVLHFETLLALKNRQFKTRLNWTLKPFFLYWTYPTRIKLSPFTSWIPPAESTALSFFFLLLFQCNWFILSYVFLFVLFLKLLMHCNLTLLNNSCLDATNEKNMFSSKGSRQTLTQPPVRICMEVFEAGHNPCQNQAMGYSLSVAAVVLSHYGTSGLFGRTRSWQIQFGCCSSPCNVLGLASSCLCISSEFLMLEAKVICNFAYVYLFDFFFP